MVGEHMFVLSTTTRRSLRREGIDPELLGALKERVRPLAQSRTRLLSLPEALVDLSFGEGLRRGSVLGVSGPGSLTLALSALCAASRSGMWCVALGVGDLGVTSAARLGIDIERLAIVDVHPKAWVSACATVLEGVDLLIAQPPENLRDNDARILLARVRERGALMVVVGEKKKWRFAPDLSWEIVSTQWEGIGRGYGALSARSVKVRCWVRAEQERAKTFDLWLPNASGVVERV